MKVISLFFLLLSFGHCCSLESEREFLSLSGPITMIMQDLDLLNDPALKAISSFHQVNSTASKIDGGIFLSKKYLRKYKNPIIFFDESAQLEKTIADLKLKAHKIVTKGGDPFTIYAKSLETLVPYLDGCKDKITKLNALTAELRKNIFAGSKMKRRVIFYLGELTESKRPELVISNDLFVKKWKELKLIDSYPSLLAYATWSQKILKELGDYIEIGLAEKPQIEVKKISERKFNIYFPGVLTPGLSQIKFMHYFQTQFQEARE